MPEYLTGGLLLHVKEVHFAAQLAVIALGGLVKHVQVGLELVLVLEGDTVDALQHRAVTIAAPIGPRHAHQLEGVRGHLPGMLQMRAAAQVLPVAVPVHAQRLVAGDGVDQFDLEGLAALLVMPDRAGAVPDFGAHGIAGVDDLLHLLLDQAQILGGERLGAVEIIVPAIFDHRADGDLHIRPDLLHGAGHDMGQIVADQLIGLRLVLQGVDGDAGIGGDRPLQVPMLAVDRGRDRLFRKGFRYVGGNLGRGDAGRVVARIAVGKGQGNLGHWPVSSSVWRLRNARLRVRICAAPVWQGCPRVSRRRWRPGDAGGGASCAMVRDCMQ